MPLLTRPQESQMATIPVSPVSVPAAPAQAPAPAPAPAPVATVTPAAPAAPKGPDVADLTAKLAAMTAYAARLENVGERIAAQVPRVVRATWAVALASRPKGL